jgi:hypothetical protein
MHDQRKLNGHVQTWTFLIKIMNQPLWFAVGSFGTNTWNWSVQEDSNRYVCMVVLLYLIQRNLPHYQWSALDPTRAWFVTVLELWHSKLLSLIFLDVCAVYPTECHKTELILYSLMAHIISDGRLCHSSVSPASSYSTNCSHYIHIIISAIQSQYHPVLTLLLNNQLKKKKKKKKKNPYVLYWWKGNVLASSKNAVYVRLHLEVCFVCDPVSASLWIIIYST